MINVQCYSPVEGRYDVYYRAAEGRSLRRRDKVSHDPSITNKRLNLGLAPSYKTLVRNDERRLINWNFRLISGTGGDGSVHSRR